RAAELDDTLATLARTLVVLAALLCPFMPRKMADLAARFGFADVPRLPDLENIQVGGRSVQKGPVLFPRPEARVAGSA
ncbi:MAG: hypothetical protein HY701_01235, partial [Gemmatimonadetes bacterium]|nr:hypothetical protein [Gemmatimonadota bacterium]